MKSGGVEVAGKVLMPSIKKLYGNVPPIAFKVNPPVVPPLHNTSVDERDSNVSASPAGIKILILSEAIQSLSSFTVIV